MSLLHVCVWLCCTVLQYSDGYLAQTSHITQVCCSVLQRVAACCSVLQRVAACRVSCANKSRNPSVFAVCCSVLHLVQIPSICSGLWLPTEAIGHVCCSLLQCVAVCCCRGPWLHTEAIGEVWCSLVQFVAVCCSVLLSWIVTPYKSYKSKCVAACCSVLQCVAVWCSVLQCVAVRCSVLRCVVLCCCRGAWFPEEAIGQVYCSVLRETIRGDCELPLAVDCVPARRNTMHGAHTLDTFLASRYTLPHTIGGKSLLHDQCRQRKHKRVAGHLVQWTFLILRRGVSVADSNCGFAPGYC